jgi:hypothetical protein
MTPDRNTPEGRDRTATRLRSAAIFCAVLGAAALLISAFVAGLVPPPPELLVTAVRWIGIAAFTVGAMIFVQSRRVR